MWISYSDSEVNSFHPVCERALNYALKLKGLEKDYAAKHHQTTGSLEMDYVIQNMNTGKYLCVVEVKRTPADVHSARYQFQAMSYVQMNAGQNERPFYILTNLEYAFSFRYDSTRPRVFQQMLKPGLTHVGDFSSYTEQAFTEKLGDFFAQQIDDFLNDRYDYLVTLEDFANHMEAIKSNDKRWKTHLAVLLYEYIRGAFNAVSRNELKDIRLFRSNVKRICDEAVRVNFKDIFTYSNSNFENTFSINGSMLSDIYNFGEQNINGNTIAGILHSIISSGHEHEGEVPTDLELARIVAVLAKHSSNNLKNGGIVCDPAAGSGNLINEVIPEFNLNPTQILVNDVNSKLLELLSMRIGLNYPKTISKRNSPQIYNRDIADMDKSIFNDVEVVVMNPPFCAGINSIPRRNKIYTKIKKLTGNKPYTDVGQMPLEAAFLEMVLALVKDGTTIACIFPKTHLIGRGPESQVIRRILLNSFGLHTVFTYPGEDIFDDVIMDTCVLVGHAHTRSDVIKVISSYDRIPDIDTHHFYNSLSQSMTAFFSQIMPGIVGKCVSFNELRDSIDDGWRSLNSEMVEAITFVGKKVVAELIKTAPEEIEKALSLRQKLAKSSVKKYTAMKNAVCNDNRVRGMFQFYGANRTGRFAGRLVQLQNLPQNHMPDLAETRGLVRTGNFEALELLYDDIPDTLSQLIRTAFVPQGDNKFIVADFSAIEARVLAWLAGEKWRMKVFEEGKDIYCSSASQMFGVPVEKHGINGHLRQKGKIAELALGYGGSVGALKAMGAIEMGLTEEELQPLVYAWRNSNPAITMLWWDIDNCVKETVKKRITTETHGIRFHYESGFLFIILPSGRKLAYVKPKMGVNQFGGESVTYEGIGNTKKWERLESYGPKFCENITQAIARDILIYAMQTLRYCRIVAHVHDEVIIECRKDMSLDAVCEQMGRTPPWAKGLFLRADGYECQFYKKD